MTDVVLADDELAHYGILRRSGRYPWGSGGTPEENHRSFLGYVKGLESKGLSEKDIAKGFDIPIARLRALRAIAVNEVRKADATQALRLKEKGMSNVKIGERMGINESSVRSLLDPALAAKRDVLVNTANMLADKIKDGSFLDIGLGTANQLGISSTKLDNAVAILREKGYAVHKVQTATGISGNKTTIKVLAPPGTTYVDIVKNPRNIKSVSAYTEDGGHTYKAIEPPTNISSKRIKVVYKEQGGDNADGVIYLRPGVKDLSLGNSRYAQVRIAVDGTHYLKGMAMYKKDLPPGVDLEFHTSKSNTGVKNDAFKKQKDEENPFGTVVRQRHYTDADGKKKLSPLNIVNEEGQWDKWSRNLSSQFLSKQSVGLVRQQLGFTLQGRQQELDEIRHLTNPVIKHRLLTQFADDTDSSAVHLKAAALPRQKTRVILPFSDMKENEVYAPGFRNGERVALVRFPHGGTFEIPEATVNNKHAGARAALGDAADAIGIHPKIAARLSGADFDGDTVLVIPNNRGQVTSSAPLKGLEHFDPKSHYAPYDGMRTIDGGVYHAATRSVDYGGKKPSGTAKQHQMGDVSNLITDMTVRGAKPEEIARAVRHSMVVIDAEKHSLDYDRSYKENGIAQLKEKYQGRGPTGRLAGASTVISNSGQNAKILVPERKLRSAKEGGPIDPITGQKVYVETGATEKERRLRTEKEGGPIDPATGKKVYVETGRVLPKKTAVAKLAVNDAHKYSSGMPVEEVYAAHSNALKHLANQARKETLHTGKQIYSPTANKVHAKEVSSLNVKLDRALKQKPLERQAQLIAQSNVKARLADNPHIDASDLKKIRSQALLTARGRLGIENADIEITPAEWTAIQNGAITTNKLNQILDHADMDTVRKLATPRAATVMTPSKLSIAKARLASGYDKSEVADSLGVPLSTLESALAR